MRSILLSLAFLSVCCLLACNQRNQASQDHNHDLQTPTKSYYTCSMHPQVKEDKPGKCPLCNMNLTKVEIVDEVKNQTSQDHNHDLQTPTKSYYTCPMHPQVKEDKPGKCPLCNMNLTKVEIVDETKKQNENDWIRDNKTSKTESVGEVVARVKLRKSQMRHFKPSYFQTTTMKMSKKIRLLGTVFPTEDKESDIPARIDGQVEKVYIESTGHLVKKGDPVVDLYSPNLITAGEEYLIAKKNHIEYGDQSFLDLVKKSEERLEQWGIKRFQYETWYEKKAVPKAITIYSPGTGIVRIRNAVVGKYFKEGENFFKLSDLSEVWVEMDVYEHESALVSLGQKVEMEFTALPGEMFKGKIDFVNPVLDSMSRTLKIRTTIKNPSGQIKPGMVADVTLDIKLAGHPLVIPRTAIINTGKRKVVWSKINDKQFQAKEIQTGYESEGYIEVKSGLIEGEEVVIEGNFLLDAQAQLFGGYEDVHRLNERVGGHQH